MGNETGSMMGAFLLFLGILVVLFLVCREIVCWYWKINQSVALLIEIRDLLKNQASAAQRALRNPSCLRPN